MSTSRVGASRVSARLRLALSYAAFLVLAGGITLFGVYVVLRYVPNYPLTAANPSDLGDPIATREEILGAVTGVSVAILVTLAVIGVIGGWVLAGWVLRPLQRINQAARDAAAGRLDRRIRLQGRNDEFRQLADSFDHMLDQLSDAFAAQERFAANASHELRTPLAVTETLLDVARRNPDGQDYGVLVERLSITNARAIGLTDALLRLADANAVSANSRRLDLAAIVETVVAENRAEAAALAVTVQSDIAEATLVGDAALLLQLVGNLLQNALRHNDVRGVVDISSRHDAATARSVLRVENTGAEYTPGDTARLIEPFLRGEGRVSTRGVQRGYGLGLALVARIADVHQADLVVTPRPGGGLIVTVAFAEFQGARA